MKKKWGIFTGLFITALFVFFGPGTTSSMAISESIDISGTISCSLPAGAGDIYIVVFNGPDPETDEVIGETSISAPGSYTVCDLPDGGGAYVFAYWDMDGIVAPEGPVTGDYQGEYEGNPISFSSGSVSNVDITLINDWVINWGTEGVYDTDEATEGVQNETVTNILQLTTEPQHGDVQCWGDDPWSPDGSQIVYTAAGEIAPSLPATTEETCSQICVIHADGSGFDQLTSDATCHSHASFTPDGTRIVFQKEVDGEDRTEIWIMDADGTNLQNLTEAHEVPPLNPGESLAASESKPVISPDGTMIAFISVSPELEAPACSSSGILYVMNIDGTDAVEVSEGVAFPEKHSWSPDSEWILFSGKSPTYTERSRIYKVQPDGVEAPVMLSDDGATTEYICENWAFWSPDGDHIAYHTITTAPVAPASYESYIHTLSMMNADGTEKIELLREDGSGDWDTVCAPTSWSPDSQWIAFKKYVEIEPEPGAPQYVSESESSIFLININDKDDIRQLTEGYKDLRLWWSPDGGKILFKDDNDSSNNRDENCDRDLLVINLAPWFLEDAETEDLVNGTVGGETDEVQNPDAGTIVQATEMAEGGTATVVTAKYGENPTGISFNGEFYDLYIDDPSGILGEILLTIFFTGDPQIPHWFDGDNWQEFDEADYETDDTAPEGYDGTIYITLTNDTIPGISDFSGTAVGLGTPEGGESSSGCFIESLLN